MKRRSFLIGACSLASIPLIERMELIAKPLFFDMGAHSYEDEPFPHFARGDYEIVSVEALTAPFHLELVPPYTVYPDYFITSEKNMRAIRAQLALKRYSQKLFEES